jgi:superfamily II DNA or RNA helicase
MDCYRETGVKIIVNKEVQWNAVNKVFEWYLGPYVFTVKEQNIRKVRVNMVYYNNPNPLYSGNDTLANGKPCIARITNNITEFSRRNQILLEILRRIADNPLSHTLTLSDRREHLRYLYEQIVERDMSTVGYYVGGMKERDLKESESKKIMLSTFTMASEALDVSSLNTLVLMTSHSGGSVHTQSCGRILRKSHDEIIPTIWDFVDDFSVFKNQAVKRMDYYKKQNFEIYKVIIHDDDVVPLEQLFDMLNKLEIITYKNKKKTDDCVHVDKPKASICLLDEEDEY